MSQRRVSPAMDDRASPAMHERRASRAGRASRLFAWSVAIGLVAAVAQAFAVLGLSDSIGQLVGRASGDLGQAATGLVILSLLLAAATFLVALLAGLSAELPLGVGCLGGLLALLVPNAVLALGEGLDSLGPAPLSAIRVAAALVCAGAGAAGVVAGRRFAR